MQCENISIEGCKAAATVEPSVGMSYLEKFHVRHHYGTLSWTFFTGN